MTLFVPHAYQERAYNDVMDDRHHGLFLDPGLGKSSVILWVIKDLLELCELNSALIIAPLRVTYTTWKDEIEKWAQFNHLRAHNLHGTSVRDRLGFNVVDTTREADIYLLNPEGLPRLFGRPIEQEQPDDKPAKKVWANGPWVTWKNRPRMLVIDESTKFKNSQSIRSRTLRRYLDDFTRRVILTGTPAPNGVQDLFGQMLIVDGGDALGSKITHFRKNYMKETIMGGGGRVFRKYVAKDEAFAIIQAKIRPRVTVLEAGDYVELPDVITTDVPIILPAKARRVYRDAKAEAFALLESGEEIFARGGAGVKLRQIASGQVYVGENTSKKDRQTLQLHKEKLDAVKDLIDQLGRPMLIAFEFRCDGDMLSRELGMPQIRGGTDEQETIELIRQWNAGELNGLLVQPDAASHGLNMQFGGDAICWYSLTWNLETYIQMNRRLVRQGQESRSVNVFHLVAQETVDQRVASILVSKDADQASIISALKKEIRS